MTKLEKHPRANETKAKQRTSTLDKILDIAEDLFSRHGLCGVMLKDVTERAGVDNSLIHYYFKDKDDLFDAVIARRTPVTSERRMAALTSYEREAGGQPTVEGALRAYLDSEPHNSGQDDHVWRHYGALGAQMSNGPGRCAALMDGHFDPVVLRLIHLLKQALPDCPDEDIFWGYHFVSGALMLTLARTGRIDKLSDGLCNSHDTSAVKDRLAMFMAGGFKHVCEARVREQRAQRKTGGSRAAAESAA